MRREAANPSRGIFLDLIVAVQRQRLVRINGDQNVRYGAQSESSVRAEPDTVTSACLITVRATWEWTDEPVNV